MPGVDLVFRAEVLRLVAKIPFGHVATYGQIAAMAGFPRRPRQVGMILKGLPEGTELPWHRVINALGYVPSKGRWWGAMVQIARLREEEIEVDDQGNLDLARYQWKGVRIRPKSKFDAKKSPQLLNRADGKRP
jgi:methylated-DNA-protein-cysteine methyltransferase related protein